MGLEYKVRRYPAEYFEEYYKLCFNTFAGQCLQFPYFATPKLKARDNYFKEDLKDMGPLYCLYHKNKFVAGGAIIVHRLWKSEEFDPFVTFEYDLLVGRKQESITQLLDFFESELKRGASKETYLWAEIKFDLPEDHNWIPVLKEKGYKIIDIIKKPCVLIPSDICFKKEFNYH